MPNAVHLNDYQQLTVRISQIAPYNAVHLVSLKDPNTVSLITEAINNTVSKLGIGIPLFSSDLRQVRFNATPHIPCEQSSFSLEELVEHEMNYFFRLDEFPLRFFIISDQSQIFLSITYNHWVGDAYIISRLIEAIFTEIHQQPALNLSLDVPKMEVCFQSIYKRRTTYYRYMGLIQNILRFSQAFRTPIHELENTENICLSHLFKKEVLTHLLNLSKQQQITLNDLFITVLARLFGQLTEEARRNLKVKRLKPRRNRILIGVITNLRPYSHISLLNSFGLFLGFFYLSFKLPEQYSFETLSRTISAKTQQLKKNKVAIKQYLLFKIQKFLWDKTKETRSKYRLIGKNAPITVGISNMILNQHGEPLYNSVNQYLRFSPTAMLCPVVFNLTTINHCLSLGINFRKACYTRGDAELIRDEFITEINRLIQNFSTQ